MDQTAQEIRQREAQRESDETETDDETETVEIGADENETPRLANGGPDGGPDGDEPGGGDDDDGGLPFDLTERQVAIIIGIAVVLVALRLYAAESGGGSDVDSLDEAKEADWSQDVEIEGDEQDVEIPTNSADPLAADEAVTEMFKKSGRLADHEED